jgi:hypothetical protein
MGNHPSFAAAGEIANIFFEQGNNAIPSGGEATAYAMYLPDSTRRMHLVILRGLWYN